jgi:electron transfer flavoprotein beta subunit
MANVLVCVKRVVDTGGEITLTEDGSRVDDRSLGHTVSPHEECAVELAVQVAKATDGEATVLTLGSEDAVEQLRDALAVGCTQAVRIESAVEGGADAYGPADVAAAIADVVRAHEAAGKGYDLVLLGNDAADTGDFQVGIRLAYELDRPVVTGIATVTVEGDRVVATGDGPEGADTYEVPLPAVVTVMEGGVEPRYPSIPGRMRAKRVQVETVVDERVPVGSGRVRLKLPEAPPSQVQLLGEGPEAAPAVVDLLEKLGVLR